jgi:MSHA pilin protein MshA
MAMKEFPWMVARRGYGLSTSGCKARMRVTGIGGFTLIELIVVIVILGILAATALPRFVDFSADAQAAATAGVAGAVSSGSAINYAARKVSATAGVPIDDCSDGGQVLTGGLPAGYSMTPPGFPVPIPPDQTVQCVVYGPKGTNATASLTGTS